MQREQGFTLTEALIAIVVLASLSAGLLLSVRTIIEADKGIRESVQGLEGRALFSEVMRDTLRYSYRPPNADTERRFRGDPAGFAVLTHPQGRAAPARAALRSDGASLELSLEPLAAQAGGGERVRLLEDVARIRFSYFGRTTENGFPTWHAEWEADWAPLLVSVEIQEENGQIWRIEALVEGQGAFDCPLERDAGICMEQ